MYEERDRYRELIEELHSIQTFEQQDKQKRHEKIRMIELQQLQNDQSIQEDRLCEILNSLEGRTICGTLDFLSKVCFVVLYRSNLLDCFSLSSGTGEIRG